MRNTIKRSLSAFLLPFLLLLSVVLSSGEPSYEEAKAKIAGLVQKFDSRKEFYTSSDYLEKEVRRDFIDPFFEALGWDVLNSGRNSLFLQDTVPETRLPIEGSLKYADYGMRLDARAVFYVEAKAASKDIDSPEYTFQAKRYAWSSMRAELVVITDFETLRVYDTRPQPSFDAPHLGMIAEFRISYKDYPEKFSLLWETFSKEAVRKGSLVRLLEKSGKKLERVPADERFIADFDARRLSLGATLLERNPGLSGEELNAATLRILNRIVFTRILEDRDIEPTGRLRDCVMQSDAGKASLRELLKKEFLRLQKRYDNVLFTGDPTIDGLDVPDDRMRDLIMAYYPPQCPYDFSAMPVAIMGKTYENCLGKLLVKQDGKLRLEEKPEVREAGGVFYVRLMHRAHMKGGDNTQSTRYFASNV